MAVSSNQFMIIVSVVAAAAVIAGLTLIDSPGMARLHKLDERREISLRIIGGAVGNYVREHNDTPLVLSGIGIEKRNLVDPETGEPYEYKAISNSSYRICAVFDTASDDDPQSDVMINTMGADYQRHTKGRTCFTRNISPAKNGLTPQRK